VPIIDAVNSITYLQGLIILNVPEPTGACRLHGMLMLGTPCYELLKGRAEVCRTVLLRLPLCWLARTPLLHG